MTTLQTDLFELTIAQRFEAWKASPGGRFCLCKLYAITAGYYRIWQATGNGPSTRLVWEQLRYHLDDVRRKLKARGKDLSRERGFWLNDHFTALAVRHMLAHRKEWDDLFELREIGKERFKRKVLVIKEPVISRPEVPA